MNMKSMSRVFRVQVLTCLSAARMQHRDNAYDGIPPRANTAQSLDNTLCGSEERIIGGLTTVCLVAETHVTCGRLVSTPCLVEIDGCIVTIILCNE